MNENESDNEFDASNEVGRIVNRHMRIILTMLDEMGVDRSVIAAAKMGMQSMRRELTYRGRRHE